MLFLLILIVMIVFIDQLTKWLAVICLQNTEAFTVIPGILKFEYTENRGMAFGLLDGHRWVFMLISSIAIAALLIFLWRKPPKSRWCLFSLAFIIGGGIGNMIDRTLLGYVIDFIYPCMIPELWPWVFNVADSFVTVGAGMLMVYLVREIILEARAEKAAKVTGAVSPEGDRNPESPIESEAEENGETDAKVGETDERDGS